MTTAQILIVSLAAVAIVALVAFAQWRTRATELDSEERLDHRREAARAVAKERDADRESKARLAMGPDEGTVVAVHVGPLIVQGTRVLCGAPRAEGWIVLDDAEVREGNRSTPLGGRQWISASDKWLQELSG